LKQKLKAAATSLTPAQALHQLKQIQMVEVWFDLRQGGKIACPASPNPKRPSS
jgi:hypothetical protein